jgi:hypothetical protein
VHVCGFAYNAMVIAHCCVLLLTFGALGETEDVMHPAAAAFVCVLSARNFTNALRLQYQFLSCTFYLCGVGMHFKIRIILLHIFSEQLLFSHKYECSVLRKVSHFKCISLQRELLSFC